MAIAQAVSMVAGLMTITVLTRNLGPEAYGVLGFCLAIISYFGLLTNFGMDVHGTREIARDHSLTPSVVGAALLMRCSLAIVGVIILLTGLMFFNPTEQIRSTLVILSVGLAFVATNVEFAYQGLQKMSYMAARQICAALAVMLATITFVATPEDVMAAATIPVAANTFTALVLLAHFRNYVSGIEFKIVWSRYWAFLKRSAPIALLGTLVAIQISIDIVMLGILRADHEVGLYTAVSRLFAIALIVGNLLHSVYLPVFSETGSRSEAPPPEVKVYGRIMSVLGGALCLGGTIMSGAVIEVLFGAEFRAAETSLILLLVSAGLFHFGLAYGTPLLAWQSDRAYLKILLIGAGANLALNALLIPHFGIEGAAFATLTSQFIVLLALGTIVWRAFRLSHARLLLKSTVLAYVCCLPMLGLRFVGLVSPLQTIGAGLVLVGLFLFLCGRTGVIDYALLRQLLPQRS